MTTKQDLLNQCLDLVNKRLLTLANSIDDIQKSLTTETKSTAGDKHETGRAMLHLEREKAGQQLAETQKLGLMLSKIDVHKSSKTICLGSVVHTSNFNYFIAISFGDLTCNNTAYYAISPNTPVGMALMGKQVGDVVAFRNTTFTILNVE